MTKLTPIERDHLLITPIDHLIGRTIRLVDQLRRSTDPNTAAIASEVWKTWRIVRSAVVKSSLITKEP
jgi:hypothetical protein